MCIKETTAKWGLRFCTCEICGRVTFRGGKCLRAIYARFCIYIINARYELVIVLSWILCGNGGMFLVVVVGFHDRVRCIYVDKVL